MALIIGHRGFAAKHPENTMTSFRAAIEAGADGIELDVHVSRDGQLVVMHDETVDRTTDGKGAIKDLDYETIRQLDAGGGEHPPLLEEALLACKAAKVLLNIEIKAREAGLRAVELVQQHGYASGVIVSSFKHDVLSVITASSPGIKTAALVPTTAGGFVKNIVAKALNKDQEAMIAQATTIAAAAINPFHATCTAAFMERAKAAGLDIYPWTVDTPKLALKLASWGATGIITNHPARLIEAGVRG